MIFKIKLKKMQYPLKSMEYKKNIKNIFLKVKCKKNRSFMDN